MKAKYILSGLLMVALVIGGTGYGVSAKAEGKVTGGGTFNHAAGASDYASPGNKISFGFNGQRLDNGKAKGQFQLINHNTGMKMHGTFSTYDVIVNGPWEVVVLGGECSINGTDEPFRAEITAKGNGFEIIEIWIGDSPPTLAQIRGQIHKGNITKHDK